MKAALVATLALIIGCSADAYVDTESDESGAGARDQGLPVFIDEGTADTLDGCGRSQGYPIEVPTGGTAVIEMPLECNPELLPEQGDPPPDSEDKDYVEQSFPESVETEQTTEQNVM